MKEFHVWAVVRPDDKIDAWNWRVPVYWYRRQALEAKKQYAFSDSRIVRVKITEAPVKRARHV